MAKSPRQFRCSELFNRQLSDCAQWLPAENETHALHVAVERLHQELKKEREIEMFTEHDWKILKAFDRAAPNAIPGVSVERAEQKLNEALLAGEPKPGWMRISTAEWEQMRQQAIEEDKVAKEQDLIIAWEDAGKPEPFESWAAKNAA